MSLQSSSSSASTLIKELINGSHDFKIKGYSLDKPFSSGTEQQSEECTVAGYSWSISCVQNVNAGVPRTGKVFSCGYVLSHNATIVNAKIRIRLLHNTGDEKRAKEFNSDMVIFSAPGWQWRWVFPEESELEADYLKDDCLHIHCVIGVLKLRMEVPEISVPPSDIIHCFGSYLDSGDGSDVSFEVDGQIVYAHKFLLAPRSSVFKAQFWGLMKDQNEPSIKIEDIDAPTFKAMLHFIYHDDVPDSEGNNSKESSTLMFQHLLAAADRYHLDRLLLLCAAKLYENIDVDTAATTLVLAEQHNCFPLKSACIKYIALPENLQAVKKTAAFKCIKESYSNVYVELLERIAGFLDEQGKGAM